MNKGNNYLALDVDQPRHFLAVMSATSKLLTRSYLRRVRSFSVSSFCFLERSTDATKADIAGNHEAHKADPSPESKEDISSANPKVQFSAIFDKMIESKRLFEPGPAKPRYSAPSGIGSKTASSARASDGAEIPPSPHRASTESARNEPEGVDVSQLKTKMLFSEIFDKIIGSREVFDSTPKVSLKSALLSEKVGYTKTAPILDDVTTRTRDVAFETAQPLNREALNYLYPWLKHIQAFEYSHEVIDYFTNKVLPMQKSEQKVPETLSESHGSDLDDLILNSVTAPILLDNCLRVLLSNFRDPNSCLLLVQTVKRRSHEDYLLYCDAAVFTTLVNLRWIYYRSIPDVLDLLTEMAQNVIPFTMGTRVALSEIMKEVNAARHNGTLNKDGIPLWAVDQYDNLERVTKSVTRQIFDAKQKETLSLLSN